MENHEPKIDAYIARSASFAQPILNHIRKLAHQACPEIKETIKWGMPFFDYKGTVCNMAAFKAHCSFGFWKSSLMADPHNLLKENTVNAMGQMGRITSVDDLPPDDVMLQYIREAVKLNEEGVKITKPAKSRTELLIPDYLVAVLGEHPEAKKTFDNFSYSNKKEYVQWIIEAKTDATREKRIANAMEWLAEGKPRMWKYERK